MPATPLAPGQADSQDGQHASRRAPAPRRPWYTKKRFLLLIAVGFLAIVYAMGSLGDDFESEAVSPPAATEPVQGELAPEETEMVEETEAAPEQEIPTAGDGDAPAPAGEAAPLTGLAEGTLDKAAEYLVLNAFSRPALAELLEYEGASAENASFALDRLEADGGVDWNAQAARKARDYATFASFSRSELIDQLVLEGFTAEQAEHGVSTSGL